MSLCMKRSLRKLRKLAPERLHGVNLRIRRDLGGSEWKMGVCLLAMARTKAYLELGYASLNEYAEKSLRMSGKKAHLLVLTVRAMEYLPMFSAAYQEGLLCWGKVRSLQSVVTPETEEIWFDYALDRTVTEVVNAVSMSPAAWKRQEGLNASLKQKPIVGPQDVQQIFGQQAQQGEVSEEPEVVVVSPAQVQAGTLRPEATEIQGEAPVEGGGEDERPFAPPYLTDLAPKTIRVTVEFTPDQYAIFEMSERCAKAQVGGRVDRASAVVRMCEGHLASTPSRTRLKYQVVVHASAEGEQGWYDTGRGPLPASPAVVRQAQTDSARAQARPKNAADPKVAGESEAMVGPPALGSVVEDRLEQGHAPGPPSAGQSRRVAVPAATLRALYLRAGNKCERCGCTNAGLHVHHKRPVCEGGTNDLEGLELLCGPCHSGHHESDFQSKPHWQSARSKAVVRSYRERCDDPPAAWVASISMEQPDIIGSGHLSSA